jgi:hypothetical protein
VGRNGTTVDVVKKELGDFAETGLELQIPRTENRLIQRLERILILASLDRDLAKPRRSGFLADWSSTTVLNAS